MTDALATVAAWLGAIALALVVLLLIVAMLAFLARRVRPVVRVDPWVNHSGVPALDIGGGLASLLLGELQRIQRVLNDAVNDPEMTAGTVADLTPVTDADVGDAPDLLPSVELEGKLGAVMAAARAATLSLSALVPITALVGSVQQYGEALVLDLRLTSPPSRWRRSLFRRRAAPEQAASWHLEGLSVDELPAEVRKLAYDVYLRLGSTTGFRSAEAFSAYIDGLDAYMRVFVRSPAAAARESEPHFVRSAELDGNARSLLAAGAVRYACYRAGPNREAARDFRRASDLGGDPRVTASAKSGWANALVTGVVRFREYEGDPVTTLRRAKAIASEAASEVPDLAVAHKASAYALHQLSEQPGTPPGDRDGLRRQAEAEYEQAIRLNPRYVFAANNLGNLRLQWAKELRADGRPEEARDQLARAEASLSRAESHRHALENLGEVWLERYRLIDGDGRSEEERAALQQASEYLRRAIDASMAGDTPYPEAENMLAIVTLLAGREDGITRAMKEHLSARDHVIAEYAELNDHDGRNRRLAGFCSALVHAAREAFGGRVQRPDAAADGTCGCETLLRRAAADVVKREAVG